MENLHNKFKKAKFGGFNRKDVIDYIEKIQNEFYQYKLQAEKTVNELNEKIAELEGAVSGEAVAVESISTNACSSQDAFSTEQISAATGKLKCVADELCQSINDLIEKISEGGAEVTSEEKTDSDEVTVCTDEPTDKVQSILGKVSSIFTNSNEETATTKVNEVKEERKSPFDILNSASFII